MARTKSVKYSFLNILLISQYPTHFPICIILNILASMQLNRLYKIYLQDRQGEAPGNTILQKE